MRTYDFKATVYASGTPNAFADRNDLDALFDQVCEAVFETFEGDVTPALVAGVFAFECSIRDRSLESAGRRLFDVLAPVFGGPMVFDGITEGAMPSPRSFRNKGGRMADRHYSYGIQAASYA